MGCSKPIVATDIKGNRESITHNYDGLLVRPADAESLAEGLIQLARNADLTCRLGCQARKTFRSRFTVEAMLESTWCVYRDLMKAKNLL